MDGFALQLRLQQMAQSTHQACLSVLIDAFEQAKISGLCAEGAWELAIDVARHMDLPVMGQIVVKRIYDAPSSQDGNRVLVDRLWPRGVSKSEATIDYWVRDLAPSTALRKWFNHAPKYFAEFTDRYQQELKVNQQTIDDWLAQLDGRSRLTLLTATKDLELSHAWVLKEYLQKHQA